MGFTKEEIERFNSKVTKRPDCWEWGGGKFASGYGIFSLRRGKRKTFLAHRVSWMIHKARPVPNGMVICHTCDNRICVNPSHLYLGTSRDNNLDTVRRGRGNRKVGESCFWAKATEEAVLEIRRSSGRGAQIALAKKFGISPSQVSHIKSGRRWKWVAQVLPNG